MAERGEDRAKLVDQSEKTQTALSTLDPDCSDDDCSDDSSPIRDNTDDIRIVEAGGGRHNALGLYSRCNDNHELLTKRVEYQPGINKCCDNKFWCVNDVCGLSCVIITYGLLLYSEIVVTFLILNVFSLPSMSVVVKYAIYQGLMFMAIIAHQRSMLTDPGAVLPGDFNKEHLDKLCSSLPSDARRRVIVKCLKCVSVKPERAHHCSVCRRCVRRMDHHCPWINNCVGEANQKYFILFTLYICLLSVYVLILDVLKITDCIILLPDGRIKNACSPVLAVPSPVALACCTALGFICLLFALFTAIMFRTQACAVWNDRTGIESLKSKSETSAVNSRMRWKSVEEIMGRYSLISWLSPFHPPLSRYERPSEEERMPLAFAV